MDDPERSGILAFARSLEFFNNHDLAEVYEPVSTTPAGRGLFKIGVGRRARSEITGLLAAVLEANPVVVRVSSGTYSRMSHLSSLPLDDKTVASEKARGLFARIPRELARMMMGCALELSRENSSRALVGMSEGELAAKSDYRPVIKYVETAACNRWCGHCSTMAGPRLPGITFDEIAKGFDKLPPSDEGVGFTFGEPFRWADTRKEEKMNIGHAIRYLLERFPGIRNVGVATSGINFADPLEAGAAEVLANMPQEWRRKVLFVLSLSDFPHFKTPGMGRAQAARKAQKDTARFLLENGFELRFNSFLEQGQYDAEIALPVCEALFPQADPREMKVFAFNGVDHDRVGLIGRAALREREYFLDSPFSSELEPCLGFSGIRLPRGSWAGKDELMATEKFPVEIGLALSHGGSLGPGCCMVPAQLGVVSDTGKSYERIKEDAVRFMGRIRRLKSRNKLTCMRCIGTTHHVRDPERFVRSVGPENAALIPASKLRIRR